MQVLDGRNTETYTSHGDVFPHLGRDDEARPAAPAKGSQRCLPSEQRCKPSPEWNHYRITCNDGVLKLAVNGKEVSGGSKCRPRKGYICLESEGSECHFRNLKIQELPSTNPSPAEIADEAQGFVPIYTGLDLAGWRQVDGPGRPLAAEGLGPALRRQERSGRGRATSTSGRPRNTAISRWSSIGGCRPSR